MANKTPMDSTSTSSSTTNPAVSNPKHYELCVGVEALDVIEAALDHLKLPPHQSYLMGNLLKYRLRAGNKDDLEQDIAKADEYKRRLNELRKPKVFDYKCVQSAYAQLHAQRSGMCQQPIL